MAFEDHFYLMENKNIIRYKREDGVVDSQESYQEYPEDEAFEEEDSEEDEGEEEEDVKQEEEDKDTTPGMRCNSNGGCRTRAVLPEDFPRRSRKPKPTRPPTKSTSIVFRNGKHRTRVFRPEGATARSRGGKGPRFGTATYRPNEDSTSTSVSQNVVETIPIITTEAPKIVNPEDRNGAKNINDSKSSRPSLSGRGPIPI